MAKDMQKRLTTWAYWVSQKAGSPLWFFTACAFAITWLGVGHYYNYSGDWFHVMEAVCATIPFVMLFLLQASQNFDSKALHTKLDEIILSLEETDDQAAELEEKDEQQVDQKRDEQKSRLRNSTVE